MGTVSAHGLEATECLSAHHPKRSRESLLDLSASPQQSRAGAERADRRQGRGVARGRRPPARRWGCDPHRIARRGGGGARRSGQTPGGGPPCGTLVSRRAGTSIGRDPPRFARSGPPSGLPPPAAARGTGPRSTNEWQMISPIPPAAMYGWRALPVADAVAPLTHPPRGPKQGGSDWDHEPAAAGGRRPPQQ